MEPTIITYTGDGKTKTFSFGFSFFQPNDIIVETNGAPTSVRYALQTAKPSPTADMPYYGGAVCFADAPAAGVEIKIYREFVMTRPGDFQSTAEIQPEQLNRELNFNLENMRDFRDRQHATNATVKEHGKTLGEHGKKITEHDDKIAQIIKQILLEDDNTPTGPDTPTTPPADTSEIAAAIAQLQTQVSAITTQMSTFATTTQMTAAENNISTLDTRVDNAENNIANLDTGYAHLTTDIANINPPSMLIPDWESGINKQSNFTADQYGVLLIKCNRGAYSKISLKINNIVVYELVPDTSGINCLLYSCLFPVAPGDVISITGNNSPQATFYSYRK